MLEGLRSHPTAFFKVMRAERRSESRDEDPDAAVSHPL